MLDRVWFAALDLDLTALSTRAVEMAFGHEFWKGVSAHATF
jgi:hypothetical protein